MLNLQDEDEAVYFFSKIDMLFSISIHKTPVQSSGPHLSQK